MNSVLPREEEVEAIFSQILASPDSCKKLMDIFYDVMDDNHLLEADNPKHFSKVLFYAYQNGFKETYKNHICAPRSKLYLADGYDIVRSYVNDTDMEITEKRENKRRGIMILYALPDTKKIGLTEAQAYAVVWDTFHNIQKEAPHAIVYYGQETGLKKEQTFDEIGILLPIREFEKKMLHHLSEIDGLVLACREKMMKKAGMESLEL